MSSFPSQIVEKTGECAGTLKAYQVGLGPSHHIGSDDVAIIGL